MWFCFLFLEVTWFLSFAFYLVFRPLFKTFRFSFVTHATFFDRYYKPGQLSALKSSHNITRGYLFLIFLPLYSFKSWLFCFGSQLWPSPLSSMVCSCCSKNLLHLFLFYCYNTGLFSVKKIQYSLIVRDASLTFISRIFKFGFLENFF